MKSPAARRLLRAARWALGLLLLGLLLTRLSGAELLQVMAGAAARWPWWSAGLGFVCAGLLLGSIRWHLLLRALELPMPLLRTLRFFFIGIFFNAFFPGACGGDLARCYYAMREHRRRRGRAVFAVLLDRAIGLGVLLGFATVMVLLHPPGAGPRYRLLMLLLPLATAGFAAAVLVGAALPRLAAHPGWQRGRMRRFAGATLQRIGHAVDILRAAPGVVAAAIGCSLGNTLALTLGCVCFARAVGIDLPVVDHVTLFPAITVLSAVPLTPGSLGVREALFAALYAPLGLSTAQAVSLSLMVYAGGLFWSLAGGPIFVLAGGSDGGMKRTLSAIRSSGPMAPDDPATGIRPDQPA